MAKAIVNQEFSNWKKELQPEIKGFAHLDGEITNTLTVIGRFKYSEKDECVFTLGYRPHCVDPNFKEKYKYGAGSTNFDKHGLFLC